MATYAGKLKVAGTQLPIASTLYGTCSTEEATKEKVVTCANFDSLITGVTIHVKFTNRNRIANPTMNVNGTGAKRMLLNDGSAPNNIIDYSWNAGAIVSFTYDGTYWVIDNSRAEDLFYSGESTTFAGYVFGRVINDGTGVVVAAPMRKGIHTDVTSATINISYWAGYSTSGTRNLASTYTISNISIKHTAGEVVFQVGNLAANATAGTPYVAEVTFTIAFN